MQETTSPTLIKILRDILAHKMSKNPSFSLRAFARDLGVSHTYLSLVLNGKKSLSMNKVIQFSHILKMEPTQAELFIRAGSAEKSARAMNRLGAQGDANSLNGLGSRKVRTSRNLIEESYFELESDKFRILQDWYHLPILDLTLTQDFKSDPRWIAKRLKISTEQVRSAIDRLKRLELIEEKDGVLKKTQTNLWMGGKKSNRIVRAYHQEMLNKAIAILELGGDENFQKRDVSSVTIPIDPSKLPEAKRRIDKFRKSLWKFLSDGERHELYQFNLQLFPLTSPVISPSHSAQTKSKSPTDAFRPSQKKIRFKRGSA